MDETPDIASLLYMDEPTAQEKAKALTAALRGQQAQAQQRQFLGALGGLTGSEGIANLGQTFGAGGAQDYKQAAQGLEALQGMPQARLARALQQQQLGKLEADTAQASKVRAEEDDAKSLRSKMYRDVYRGVGGEVSDDTPGSAIPKDILNIAQDAYSAHESLLLRARLGDKEAQAKLDETAAKKETAEQKKTEGIPPGYEVYGNPSEDNKKQFGVALGAQKRMTPQIQKMRKLLGSTDFVSRLTDPKTRTEIGSTAKQIQLEAKEVAKLGALSGPDMGIVEAIIADPASLSLRNQFTDFAAQLDSLDEWSNNSLKAAQEVYGIRPKAGARPAPANGPGSGPPDTNAAARARIAALKASGITDPKTIKAQLQKEGLIGGK